MTQREYYLSTILAFDPNVSKACNRYANAVMNSIGARIPPNGNGVSTAMYEELEEGKGNWKSATWSLAVSMANQGIPALAITKGHVAIVRPIVSPDTIPTSIKDVQLAQSSESDNPELRGHRVLLRMAWTESVHHTIKFYYFAGQIYIPQPFSVDETTEINVPEEMQIEVDIDINASTPPQD